ncbi:hypothetical protein K1719_043650 [Acacia pycnantha]|nr:hypothetical protein K1719_043640 [Acacia pycnantha]KAI9074356.1 hypothetical protein K1719_043650 [Acacia pycnantha]
MARKGNPISVRLDLNRSSDSSRFSEGDRESHRMEDHWKTPGTRACRERSKHTGRACFDRVSGAQLNVDIMNARCWIPGRETRATTPLCADR